MINGMISNPFARQYWLWLACCALYMLTGCQDEIMDNAQPHPQMSHLPQAHSAASEPFTLSISHGGGFTGLTTGCTLYADGQVERWERLPARQPSVLETRQVEPLRIADFKQQLERAGILDTTLQETGNMTIVVTYDAADVRHTWAWNAHDRSDTVPPALRQWHRSVKEFCQQLFAS